MTASCQRLPLVKHMSTATIPPMKLSTTTYARKKREFRDSMRKRKFVLKQLWVHPKDWDEVYAIASILREKRIGS